MKNLCYGRFFGPSLASCSYKFLQFFLLFCGALPPLSKGDSTLPFLKKEGEKSGLVKGPKNQAANLKIHSHLDGRSDPKWKPTKFGVASPKNVGGVSAIHTFLALLYI